MVAFLLLPRWSQRNWRVFRNAIPFQTQQRLTISGVSLSPQGIVLNLVDTEVLAVVLVQLITTIRFIKGYIRLIQAQSLSQSNPNARITNIYDE